MVDLYRQMYIGTGVKVLGKGYMLIIRGYVSIKRGHREVKINEDAIGSDERESQLEIYHPYGLKNVLRGYCGCFATRMLTDFFIATVSGDNRIVFEQFSRREKKYFKKTCYYIFLYYFCSGFILI